MNMKTMNTILKCFYLKSLIKLQKGKKGAVQLEAVIKANKSLIDKNPIFEKFLIESMLDLGVF